MVDWVMDAMKLTDEDVYTQFAELGKRIQQALDWISSREALPVTAGSSLAGDDARSAPYQVSHAVRALLLFGIDHLHAVKTLVVDHRTLNVTAPFTLVRGALENLSIAYWILHPSLRNDRITHTLRWHAQNYSDSHKALAAASLPNHIDANTKIQKLVAVASAQQIPWTASTREEKGFGSTEIVRYAGLNGVKSKNTLFYWQMCSGFAHGRQWAVLGASDTTSEPTSDPTVQHVGISADPQKVLQVSRGAWQLFVDVVDLYQLRAETHIDKLTFGSDS